uniref:Uncharacterized protein n=1 Tax=Athene cunicularia TaxID=194338 RepID=A0A663MVV6_ATHCN
MPIQIPPQKKKFRKGRGFSSSRIKMELFDILDRQTHLPRANTGRRNSSYEESYLRN